MKIILFVAVAFLLVACSDSSKGNESAESSSAKKEISKQVQETAQVVSKSTEDVVEKAKVVAKESVKQVQETTKKVAKEVKKVATKVVAQKAPSVNGKTIFAKCAGCHGSHAERKALGKSHIIKGWDASKVVSAINGYKAGTYGSTMKGVMKSQVSGLSDAEIQAVANYISKQ